MKIIFLDIDGVLNSWAFWERKPIPEGAYNHNDLPAMADAMLDVEAVVRLNTLIERTGAVVVVSSTWRRLYGRTQLQEVLGLAGFKGIVIDKTPCLGGLRGHEIQDWLNYRAKRRADVEAFVIIDDDSDMAHLMPNLVQTTCATGLLDEHVEAAAKLLS